MLSLSKVWEKPLEIRLIQKVPSKLFQEIQRLKTFASFTFLTVTVHKSKCKLTSERSKSRAA